MNYKKTVYLSITLFLFFWVSGCAPLFFENYQFEIYETPHYTFFYLRDSKISKDLKDIGLNAEKALMWASKFIDIEINIKISGYLYDDYTKSSYFRTVKSVETASTFANEYCFQYCYDRDMFNLEYATPVILHESMHIIQASYFFTNNIGLYEGHSTYMQLKYKFYQGNYNDSERSIFNSINEIVKTSLINDKEFPHSIFGMTNSAFQDVDSETLIRNPKKRYEICASFIAYI